MANPQHLKLLLQSTANWNSWREKHPDIMPDLRDANLSDTFLIEADLRNADLSNANLSNACLIGVNLDNTNFYKALIYGTGLNSGKEW